MINPAIKTNPQPERAAPRVLYMLRYYPRFSETFIVNEILELERRGVDVQILSMRRPDDGFFHESVCRVKAVARYMPETTEKLRERALPHARRILARAGREARRRVRALRRKGHVTSDNVLGAIYVIRQIQKSGVDHVHVHFGKEGSTLVYLASILAGVPYSMTLHAFDIFRDDVDRELLSRKINAAKRVVTVSDYNRRFLMEHFDIQDPDKVCVLYNGIDTDRFVVRPTRRQAGTILSVGRLIEKKGFIYLIDAVALLRDEGIDVTCRILGEGKHADQVRQRVIDRDVEDRVELPGLVRQDRVSELMSEAGCFVLPCIRAADGNVDALPTVLLEAMACGTPCISTRISGIPEIIDDRINGLLVRPGDVRALADAIKHLMKDPGQAEQLGRNARHKVETCFDVRKNVATLHDLFAQMTTGESGTQRTADKTARQTLTREKVRSA